MPANATAARSAPKPAAPTPDPGAVLAKAVVRAADGLGLTGARVARVLGVSPATVSRYASGARPIDPASKEGELALLLIRCFRSLDTLVGGNDAQRAAWMASPNRALNGVPRELVTRAEGLVATVAYLDRMRAPL